MPASTLSVATPFRSPLETFVACTHEMLDPATPESARRRAEPRLLAVLPALQALGVFELFAIRDPALAAMVRDELEARRQRHG
ncbi:MAG TPA: hypothetical protein VJR95_06895 [Rhodanobacter sp.]|nr:hypothetical protein [Rhodanobacter sp.]